MKHVAASAMWAGAASVGLAAEIVPGSDRGHSNGYTLTGTDVRGQGWVLYTAHGSAYGQSESYMAYAVHCPTRKQVFLGQDSDLAELAKKAEKTLSYPAQVYDDIGLLDRDEFQWHLADHVCKDAYGTSFPPYDERDETQ